MKKKKEPTEKNREAHINGRYILVAAVITGVCAIIAAKSCNTRSNEESPPPIVSISPPEKEKTSLGEPERKHRYSKVMQINDEILKLIFKYDNEGNKGLLDKIRAKIEDSIKIDPNDGETHYFFAELYWRQSNLNEALVQYNEAEKFKDTYSHYHNIYYGRGNVYAALANKLNANEAELKNRYYDQSLSDFQKSISDITADHPPYKYIDRVYFAIAQVYFWKKEWENAEKYYTKSIQENPQYFSPYLERATTYYQLGVSDTDKSNLLRKALIDYQFLVREFKNHKRLEEATKGLSDTIKMWVNSSSCKEWLVSSEFNSDIATLNVHARINSRDGLRIRKDPSTDADNIITLKNGEDVQVLEKNNEDTIDGHNDFWYKVKTNDYEGYMFGAYLYIYPFEK